MYCTRISPKLSYHFPFLLIMVLANSINYTGDLYVVSVKLRFSTIPFGSNILCSINREVEGTTMMIAYFASVPSFAQT